MPRLRAPSDRVTIQAVAARASVSAMTVSNVFNRRGKTSPETRDRVLQIIREMGYVPSQAARSLVGAAAARIGLMYHLTDSPFFDAGVSGIAIAVADRGLQLLTRDTRDITPDHLLDVAQSLVRSGAEALLLMPPFAEVLAAMPQAAELGVPLVAIATAGPLPGMGTVRIDNRAAMCALTQRVLAQGHRRIALVAGPAHHADGMARLEGYREALAGRQEIIIQGDFTVGSGLVAAERLLAMPQRPDAIMAASDDMAAGVMMAAHRAGLDVPHDLAITGFDDSSIASRLWPPLTTVRQPLHAMARRAVDMLSQALAEGGVCGDDVVLDFALVERSSLGPRDM